MLGVGASVLLAAIGLLDGWQHYPLLSAWPNTRSLDVQSRPTG